jgi:hypothetical protein
MITREPQSDWIRANTNVEMHITSKAGCAERG